MGRRGGGGGGGGGMRSRAPSPPPMRSAPPPPKRSFSSAPAKPAPVAPPVAKSQPRQPGLFGQMAATAAGVAVGSAVGHAVGSAMTGGSGTQEQVQQVPPETYLNEEVSGPCAFYIKQFLQCASAQTDLSLCQPYSDAVRDCKIKYQIP